MKFLHLFHKEVEFGNIEGWVPVILSGRLTSEGSGVAGAHIIFMRWGTMRVPGQGECCIWC